MHAFPSAQFLTPVEVQAPPAHASVSVQTLPSVHVAVLARCTQPEPALQLSSVHGLPSSHDAALPGTHVPPAHWSPSVQTLPSLHRTVLLVDLQPATVSQLSVVHGLPSSHVLGPVGVQTPFLHASPTVQLLLSEQVAVLFACRQPLAGSQESVVHGLPSSQARVLPGWQAPAAQASPVVQTEPSEHGKLLLPCAQPPVGSQLSAVQGLPSSQGIWVPGAHAPPAQLSPEVHALLSVHGALLLTVTQPLPGLQLSSVHRLPSSHVWAAPDVQAPPAHTSPTVQALPSVHGATLFRFTQPATLSHASSVHRLPSPHALAVPGTHWPPAQLSPTVHALLSVQTTVFTVKLQPLSLPHVSSVHGLLSLQTMALPPVHALLAHTSLPVHASPSSHGKVLAWNTQPTLGWQASDVHGLASSHATLVPGWQLPDAQASFCVHWLSSLHGAVLCVKTQPVAGAQVSSVHGLPSLQVTLAPAPHWLLAQTSPDVQAFLSSQANALAAWTQPEPGSQLSVVHGFASSHGSALPGTHTPAWQPSEAVHALLSVHDAALLVNTQPCLAAHVSSVHGLPSLHCRLVPEMHVAFAQLSP